MISWMQQFKSQYMNLDILYIQWVGQIFLQSNQRWFLWWMPSVPICYFVDYEELLLFHKKQAMKLCFMINGVQPQTHSFGRDKTRRVALINSRIFSQIDFDSSEALRELCNQNPRVLLLWHKTLPLQNVQGYLLELTALIKRKSTGPQKNIWIYICDIPESVIWKIKLIKCSKPTFR